MHILAIALGGCLRGKPRYGITEDTGGHITYVLGAMRALADRSDVSRAEIVTRLFDHSELGDIHLEPCEELASKIGITRIDSGNRDYLSKERLAADIPAFTSAVITELKRRERLPDVIHAHFADAAEVALAVREALGIPFVYTAHSLGIDKRQTSGGNCPELEQRISQENRAIEAADVIVGSSRDECERQLLAYPAADETRIHRVRPGIDQAPASAGDIDSARALIVPFLRDPGKPIILAIARPVKKKNLATLIRAYSASDALQEKANVVILPGLRQSVGRGEAEQVAVMRELVDLIDAGDLHGKVAYPRQHCASQVAGLYALARKSSGVFVNPALVEPFGLTILEAAVHGLPVVATENGGPRDIIEEIRHGVTADPADPTAIAAEIEALLDDRELWHSFSENAFANIHSVTWNEYARELRKIAGSLMRPNVRQLARCKPQFLLVCDIDNTLTGCPRSAARLTRFLNARNDIAFGVATGRSLVEARRIMRQWDLPEPRVWMTSVGSEIYWERSRVLEPDKSYAANIASGWNASAIRKALGTIEGLSPQSGVDQRVFKASYFVDDTDKLPAIRRAVRNSGSTGRVIFSHGRLLDVLPEKAGKSAAVRHVVTAMNLPMERVMVAGDSGNDVDMLGECPNAIIVANCENELRQLGTDGTVYHARREYAGGVLEGMLVHLRAMQADGLEEAA